MKTGKKMYLSQVNLHIPNDKPIVFWDTCALLDILRIPIRENLRINDLDCYERIADYIDNSHVISITSGLVVNELADHYSDVLNELLQKQTKLKDEVLKYTNLMASAKKKERLTKAINLLNIEHRLDEVIRRILKKTFVLKEENEYRNFAD